MNGYLDPAAASTPAVVTVSGLPASITGGGYDVYVYVTGEVGTGTSTRTYNYAIGTTMFTVSQTGPTPTSFTSFTLAPAGGAGNYVVFRNLTAATFTLTATPGTGNATRAPVNGLQIVAPTGSVATGGQELRRPAGLLRTGDRCPPRNAPKTERDCGDARATPTVRSRGERSCYESICNGRSGATTVSGPSWHKPASAAPRAVLGLAVPAVAGSRPRLPGMIAGERVIGRDPSCAIELSGNDVSRRHAALRRDEAGAAPIADLGSRNGVRVNGRLVVAAPLGAGRRRAARRLGRCRDRPAPGALDEIAPGVLGRRARSQAALAPLRGPRRATCRSCSKGRPGPARRWSAGALHRVERPDRSAGRGQLRRAARGAGRGRAVRLPARRLHRRRPREPRILPQRRGRDAAARRGLGSAACRCRRSCCACSSSARCSRWARRGRCRSTCGSSSPGSSSLMESVRAGRFRADLLARLDGLTVRLPPLRERREDVAAAVLAPARRASVTGARPPSRATSPNGCACHDWPFNVRELVLLVRRLLTLHGSEIDAARGAPAGAHRRGGVSDDAAARAATPGAGAAASAPATAAARGRARRASGADRSRCAHRAATWRARRRCSGSAASAPIG